MFGDERLPQRIWNQVKYGDECWLWTGSQFRYGYGRTKVAGKTVAVHRLVYARLVGDIPEGMCVCHRCDTPLCVNPEHLWLGTNVDNMADRQAKGRTSRGAEHSKAVKPGALRGDRWRAVMMSKLRRGDSHPYRLRPELIRRGEANPHAKVTAMVVALMRAEYAAGDISLTRLGAKYGIKKSQVSNIVRRASWK